MHLNGPLYNDQVKVTLDCSASVKAELENANIITEHEHLGTILLNEPFLAHEFLEKMHTNGWEFIGIFQQKYYFISGQFRLWSVTRFKY